MDGSKIEVGVQELRSDLRRWLEEVKSGHEVVITERGQPAARLIAATGPSAIEELIESGAIKKPRAPARPASAHERVHAKGSVSELVKAQRR